MHHCSAPICCHARYNDAVSAAIFHLGHHHPIICELHASLAELYYKERSMEAALGHMLRAYDLAKKVLGSHHRVVATYSTRLGHIYTSMNDLDHAVVMHERALLIFEHAAKGRDTAEVASSCFYLGDTLAARGDLKSAKECSIKAWSIRQRVLPSGHSQILQSLQQIAAQCEKLKEEQEACQWLEQVLAILKQRMNDEASLAAVQDVTRRLIRLKLASQSDEGRMKLGHIVGAVSAGDVDDIRILQFVVGKLFSQSPSKYIDSLIEAADAAGGRAGENKVVTGGAFAPSASQQLTCLAFLANNMDGGGFV